MRKIFMSFLGTGNYINCNYLYEEKKVNDVEFVQTAVADMFCSDFKKEDKIIVFLTQEAREKNWNSLKKELNGLELNCQISDIAIPSGKTEEEIWQIFKTCSESLEENAEIIFDITHSFRFIPMLAMSLFNYAKFLKNIKIAGIYYGAMEVLGTQSEVKKIPLEKRNAEIFNLTSFSRIQDWSFALENFIKFGSAESIVSLIKKESDSANKTLYNNLKSCFQKFCLLFQTNRGKEIVNGKIFYDLSKNLKKIEKSQNLPAFKLITDKIRDRVKEFGKNEINNGLLAVKWCVEHNLIQQAYTLLQEFIITKILDDFKLNWKNKKEREIVNYVFRVKNFNTPSSEYDDKFDNKLIEKLLTHKIIKKYYQSYSTLTGYRNSFNHGGYVGNIKGEDFKKQITPLLNELERILEEEQ